MISLLHRTALGRLLPAVVLACTLVATPASAQGNRDILWNIVSTCLDPTVMQYCVDCRWPVADHPCAAGLSCKQTTEIWAESLNYVAMRDPKMCGCPDSFVHGLAVPRAKVTGAEDPRRPNGIWEFAWDVALEKIEEPLEIALVVNPPGDRGQDQLHVHMLRLAPEGRARMAKRGTVRVENLGHVWEAAGKKGSAEKILDYGVLVALDPEGGFQVLIDKVSPEDLYTEKRCR